MTCTQGNKNRKMAKFACGQKTLKNERNSPTLKNHNFFSNNARTMNYTSKCAQLSPKYG